MTSRPPGAFERYDEIDGRLITTAEFHCALSYLGRLGLAVDTVAVDAAFGSLTGGSGVVEFGRCCDFAFELGIRSGTDGVWGADDDAYDDGAAGLTISSHADGHSSSLHAHPALIEAMRSPDMQTHDGSPAGFGSFEDAAMGHLGVGRSRSAPLKRPLPGRLASTSLHGDDAQVPACNLTRCTSCSSASPTGHSFPPPPSPLAASTVPAPPLPASQGAASSADYVPPPTPPPPPSPTVPTADGALGNGAVRSALAEGVIDDSLRAQRGDHQSVSELRVRVPAWHVANSTLCEPCVVDHLPEHSEHAHRCPECNRSTQWFCPGCNADGYSKADESRGKGFLCVDKSRSCYKDYHKRLALAWTGRRQPSGPDPVQPSGNSTRSISARSYIAGSTATSASAHGPELSRVKQQLAAAVAHATACSGHSNFPAAGDATADSASVDYAGDVGGWDVASWLGDCVVTPVANALISPLGGQEVPSQAALSFLRALGSLQPRECRAVVREVFSTSSLLDTLAEVVSVAVAELAAEAAGATKTSAVQQLSNKFAVDSFTLSFSGLSSFFSGLEGRLGPPDPKLMDAMEGEHRRSADSTAQFVTSNYGVSTCSEIEWLYVVDPNGGMAHLGLEAWPGERHSIEEEHRRTHRNAPPLADFEPARQKINTQLAARSEPPLILEEMIGARMYTGCVYSPPPLPSPRAHPHLHLTHALGTVSLHLL